MATECTMVQSGNKHGIRRYDTSNVDASGTQRPCVWRSGWPSRWRPSSKVRCNDVVTQRSDGTNSRLGPVSH